MSIYVGESRGELLAWLNDLLDAHAPKKIEECGKGYTYCQVVDSIFGDLPMSKVKFNARMDYEYLDNFKVLQKAFKTHGIDKPIPVEKLVKCKMQDNLEFMQWLKKYWDMHSRGEGYDASGRSGGFAPPAPAPSSSRNVSSARTAATRAPVGGAGPRTVSAASNSQLQELRGQLAEMQAHCEALEKERDFYYSKLRNIELIVQERSTVEEVGEDEKVVLGKLQDILYQTEDGFELPENALEDEVQALQLEDEETF